MRWLAAVPIAMHALGANRLRSALTMLGIVVGVASLITMLAVGSGAQTQVADQIRSLGANVLMVEPGASESGGVRSASGSVATLTESDAQEIARLSHVRATAPSVRGTVQIVHRNKNWNTTLNGTTIDYFAIRDWPLAAGRPFSYDEETAAGKVAVIGATVAGELFGDADPIGGEIRIADAPFQVIGVLAEKGVSGSGRNQDDIVFVPIRTAKLRLIGSANVVHRESVEYILVKTTSEDVLHDASREIEGLLRQRHRIPVGQMNDFSIGNPAEAMKLKNASTRTFAWLLASVASVSMIVGGISIMNIMLVSVSERTREIGLRLAVGARRRDIRNQFLIEAVALCVLGGIAGLLIGAAASIIVARFAEWPVFIGPEAVLFAVFFAVAVGVFFGWYPAQKAARMDPAAALRSE